MGLPLLSSRVVPLLFGLGAMLATIRAGAQVVAPRLPGDPAVETSEVPETPEAPAPAPIADVPPPAPTGDVTPPPVAAQPAEAKRADGEFPTSGSQPGTPLHEYDANASPSSGTAEEARSWAVEPGTESEDYLLFPPRALLFLPKVVLEVVFTPLEILLAGIDRNKVIPRVIDFFYFDDAHTAGWHPTIGAETGYGFTYGATVFHNDLMGHDESLSAAASFGGRYVQSYEAVFEGDRVGGSHVWLETRARYELQPATLFFGYGSQGKSAPPGNLGPRDANTAVRFRQERALGLLRLGTAVGNEGDLTKLGGTAIYNHRVFGSERRSFPEPSIETVYDTAKIPGFDEHLNLLELDANLVRDTRDTAGLASSGTYFELLGGGLLPLNHFQYWHYGGEITQYFDLYRKTRVLVFRAAVEGVAGNEDEIPFVDMPRLGGAQDLRGYLADKFRDKVAAVGTIEYRYPIHELLSGKLFLDAGDVGRDFDDLFSPGPFEHWKVGGGGGLLLHSKDDVILSLDVAYGDQLTVFFTTAPLEFFHNRSKQL